MEKHGKGVMYAVGVGPGDPQLITYKAARTIAGCDVVAAARSGGGKNTALDIAREHIADKQVLLCDMPMTHDTLEMDARHDEAAEKIAALLDAGKSVAFVTLGDPSVYSSAMYIHKRLKAKGHKTAMIPGVTSFCAAAASLDIALCERSQELHILPAAYDANEQAAALSGTRVLMKPGKRVTNPAILQNEDIDAMMVENASLPDERVVRELRELPEKSAYFSMIIIKDKETTV